MAAAAEAQGWVASRVVERAEAMAQVPAEMVVAVATVLEGLEEVVMALADECVVVAAYGSLAAVACNTATKRRIKLNLPVRVPDIILLLL